jgi:nucleotide-binding universal stress UspA family protein
MTEFAPQRILCPIDFSEYSAAALQVAGGIARAFKSEINVLHAQRLEAPVYFTVSQAQALKTQLRRSARAAQKHARDFANQHLGEAREFAVSVTEDDPVSAILKAQEDTGAGLIVMGTHGRSGLARLRLGSVTESILHRANVPVLTVGPHAKHRAGPSAIHRVLCPVIFTPFANVSLHLAAAVAAQTDAELLVAHIDENPLRPTEQDSLSQLCGWIPPSVRTHCTVREVVKRGVAAEQIVAEAEKTQADLVVLGVQPRSHLGAALLGSTAELVIRTAPCPVLSIVGKVEASGAQAT